VANYFIVAIVVVVGIIATLVFGVWGLPVFLVALVIGVGYVLLARRGSGEPVGTVQRGPRNEPTGVPRKARADAETANERVGQG
jgi:hypothetical protein